MSRIERIFLIGWCAVLIIPSVAAYFWLTAQQRHYADEMRQRDHDRMSITSVVAGRTEPEKTPPPGHENDVPLVVKVGAYIDHINEVSIVHSTWKVDFFTWFSWDGDAQSPGETFKIVNGQIISRTLMRKVDNGVHHYVLYRAIVEITKNFNISRFPLDEHLLTVAIEDESRQSYQLRFVADEAGSDISSRAAVPGYKIVTKQTVVKPHSYKSAMGDPTLPESYRATYSQFTFGMPLARPTWGLFLKMFIAMYLSVAMGLVGLMIRGPGERLGLASTALFIAVVNGLTISGLTPDTGIATLGDEVNNLGYMAIGALIVQALIFHRYYADPAVRHEASKLFDRVTLVLVAGLYTILNVGMIVAGNP